MGKKFSFVIGGARSGKSALALKLSMGVSGRKLFIATAEAFDEEMKERIKRHRDERTDGWETIEEPRAVSERMARLDGTGVILIDCLTLWISNMMGAGLEDGEIIRQAGALADSCSDSPFDVIAVSNEVGLGIVPENPSARRFRDLAGEVNQIFGAKADDVWFVASGIPLKMK